MLKHFINTIDYAKLIEIQASSVQTKIAPEKSKKMNACNVNKKVKKHNLNNSVKRHH